ncbi:hypothetical protein OPT61_g4729 [Boeremia exigua]|uniref:Uncharacterized protein n=1 Tax=Boeremia exigua TaxID=749465 RepID=A0ACC2ID37_9PLEO|nr:hypothetical protein OPT61_g4729 [Boeremia exigua]
MDVSICSSPRKELLTRTLLRQVHEQVQESNQFMSIALRPPDKVRMSSIETSTTPKIRRTRIVTFGDRSRLRQWYIIISDVLSANTYSTLTALFSTPRPIVLRGVALSRVHGHAELEKELDSARPLIRAVPASSSLVLAKDLFELAYWIVRSSLQVPRATSMKAECGWNLPVRILLYAVTYSRIVRISRYDSEA